MDVSHGAESRGRTPLAAVVEDHGDERMETALDAVCSEIPSDAAGVGTA